MTVAALESASQLVAFFAYLLLAVFLLSNAHRRRVDPWLTAAAGLTAGWFGALAWQAPELTAQALEVLAYCAWICLLGRVLGIDVSTLTRRGHRPQLVVMLAAVVLTAALIAALTAVGTRMAPAGSLAWLPILCKLTLCLLGLVMLEQVARNTRRGYQWNLKFLSLGLATIFGYGFLLYGEALLANRVNPMLAAPWGLVCALAVPMLLVAVRRNREGALQLNVSREFVFRVGVLLAAGSYLMVIATIGTYVQLFGGAWGDAIAVLCGVLGVLGLAVALGSSRFRGRLRRAFQRHVYRSRFDYRDEWDRVTRELADQSVHASFAERAIYALAHVTASTEGAFWRVSAAGTLVPVAQAKAVWREPLGEATARMLQAQFRAHDAVIDLAEVRAAPEDWPRFEFTDDLARLNKARYIVPLLLEGELFGIIVLADSRAPTRLGGEEQRLMGLIAREVTGFLALREADDELETSRALRIMDQTTAFVVHDLKNVTAELDLMLSNAQEHRDNPAFVSDVLATAEGVSERLRNLLERLRRPALEATGVAVELDALIRQLIGQRTSAPPFPGFECGEVPVRVAACRPQLASALGHLLDNAREAAGPHGRVTVRLETQPGWAVVTVEDDGPGMSHEFIERQLFSPFVSTKARGGLGIGCYQAREQVRAAGGDVTVVSAPGRGSRFTVHLPLATCRAASIDREGPRGIAEIAHR